MRLKPIATGLMLIVCTPALAQPQPNLRTPPDTLPRQRPAGPVQPPPGVTPHCADGCLNPVEAITFASYVAPKAGVAGDFAFEVKSVGEQNGRIFLNSEADYRDRNCLTIAMPLAVARMASGAQDLMDMQKAIQGRRVTVRGIAQRVRIEFLADDKPTGKYYFQVQIAVASPRQIRIVRG